MEAESFERKRTSTEKVIRKDKIVDEEVDDEVEEEDESGGGGGAQENKKIEAGRSGRRGSSGGFRVSLSPPSCQAERCGADLSDAKRYNRRHKVCELHSKAPVVMVAGLRQRFCQQCSRFHDVGEFDEAKRSCRRRLAEHNERRRKSVAETNYNDGSKSHHHHHPMESHRGRRVHQINISGSCASKSFHIK